jgi:hypothetical protein
MKKKILVAILMIGTSYAFGGKCPTPTDANNCGENAGPSCDNSCTKIEATGAKHKDCKGSSSEKLCDSNGSGGSAGITKYTYAMLDAAGKVTTVQGDCKSCGSTVISGPTGDTVTCRTATEGKEDVSCKDPPAG